ncbi:MAG: dUTP diphosphatase [Ruminococcaceae bacterium]|nr:dUTP diphosphatase [Oscillospiraceae bacterium]
MNLNVKMKLSRGMSAPEYATDGSAAVDLRAALDEGEVVTIAPGARALIPTGISISPETRDVVAVIAGRSGLGIKKGVTLSNGIGVIDSDYRGEICVGLINRGEEPFEVRRGDRIAQMMFLPVLTARFITVDSLDETARGTGGFGSTGVQ